MLSLRCGMSVLGYRPNLAPITVSDDQMGLNSNLNWNFELQYGMLCVAVLGGGGGPGVDRCVRGCVSAYGMEWSFRILYPFH